MAASTIILPASGQDMHAEHAIGFRIGENLHKAFGLPVDLGAAVGRERELADTVGDARGLQLLLACADRSELLIGGSY